jgi:thiol-disulfide isomerase/thioredoxin
LFPFMMLFLLASASKAQPVAPRLDSTSVVKDSSGMVYPYSIWRKLATSGKYLFRHTSNDEPNTFLIYQMNQAQREAYLARMPKPRESPNFKTGDDVKLFKARAMDGYKIVPDELAGKTVVVNFWFIGCPPCREEIPELNQVAEQYKNDKDVVFIAIALDKGYDIKQFVKEHPLGYHLIDNGRFFAQKYGVNLYPTNLVIDKHGKVLFHNVGGSNAIGYWLKRSIEESKAE